VVAIWQEAKLNVLFGRPGAGWNFTDKSLLPVWSVFVWIALRASRQQREFQALHASLKPLNFDKLRENFTSSLAIIRAYRVWKNLPYPLGQYDMIIFITCWK
jgi:hypothetical protein